MELIEVSIDTADGFKIGISKGTDMGDLVVINIDEILIYIRIENKFNLQKWIVSDVLVDLCFSCFRHSSRGHYILYTGPFVWNVPWYKWNNSDRLFKYIFQCDLGGSKDGNSVKSPLRVECCYVGVIALLFGGGSYLFWYNQLKF